MMTIGINGNEANASQLVGSGQYTYELICHLAAFASDALKFQIYLSAPPRSDLPKESSNWKYKIFGPKKLWTLVGLQNRLIAEKMQGTIPDVFFSPAHYAPLYVPTKSVISIMDMSFEDLPHLFNKRDLYQLTFWTKISSARAQKIITISQFSKNHICTSYKIPQEKVIVTRLGYDSIRFNEQIKNKKSKIENITEKYKITQPYLIFLGTLQPKKNLTRLIVAFANLDRKDIQLVIAGMKNEGRGGWMYQEFFDKVKELNIQNRVVFTGYVPDEDVPFLFAGSLAYVLPSLYEGFGIPPIEAMATGVPVVVSRISCLPEICGVVPIYINDPYEISSVQQALQEALLQKASQREKRINLGLEWVKRYNWETAAKKTLEVLTNA